MTQMQAPPWVDAPTLAKLICCSVDTVENWVMQGILPTPVRRGGKRLWKWSEVDNWLTNGGNALKPGGLADAVRRDIEKNGTH